MSEQKEVEDTIGDVPPKIRGAELKEGTRIDRYQILGLLGKGGMGAVYQAYDPELDRSIAIKILTVKPHAGETVSRPQARLMREAQALAKLSHPNVVSIFDVGTYEENVYIAMEYVRGKTLRKWLKDARPNHQEIIDALRDAGKGLYAAHTEGIVHRDFKPDNVIIGDNGQVKVLDFGLARAAGAEDTAASQEETDSFLESTSGEKLLSKSLTRAGAIVGTTVYMAPEHFVLGELDEKTDQFSFCVTLFEALYGKRPFRGKNTFELEQRVIRGWIDIPKGADVPKWIEGIILKGISVLKEDRYQSMSALLDDLDLDPDQQRTARRAKRQQRLLVFTFLVMTLAVVAAIYLGIMARGRLCRAGGEKWQAFWNPEIQRMLKTSFLATGKSYAHRTWVRVQHLVGQYRHQWIAGYREACQATRTHGDQSEEALDLRMGCLDERKRQMAALLSVFGKADDKVLARAVQAVEELGVVAACADITALRERDTRIGKPKDAVTRARVEAVRERLAVAKALSDAGKYQDSLLISKEVSKVANEIGYEPLQAEAFFQVGDNHSNLEQAERANELLKRAYLTALGVKHFEFAVKSLIALVSVVGDSMAKFREGLEWSQHARAILRLVPNNNRFECMLDQYEGTIHYVKGDFQAAKKLLLRSLKLAEKTYGIDSPKTMPVLNDLGNVYDELTMYDEAAAMHRRALAILENALGSQHPGVPHSQNNLGVIYLNRGDLDAAHALFAQANASWERNLGPQHPYVAVAQNNLGHVAYSRGAYPQAVRYYARALRIREERYGFNSLHLFRSLHGLGIAYAKLGKTHKAMQVLNRALGIAKERNDGAHPSLVMALTALGEIYETKNDLRQAKRFHLAALRFGERLKGPEAPDLVQVLTALARLALLGKQDEIAIEYLERAQKICRTHECDPGYRLASQYLLLKTSWQKHSDKQVALQAAHGLAKEINRLETAQAKEIFDSVQEFIKSLQ